MVLIPAGKKRKKKETYSSGEKMLLNDLNEALEWHFCPAAKRFTHIAAFLPATKRVTSLF